MANLPIRLQPSAAVDRIEGWEADVEGRRVLEGARPRSSHRWRGQ